MKNKRGNILTENVIFIVITIVFIASLFAFVARSSSTVGLIEEAQAKKLALVLDSARPGTSVLIDVKDVVEKRVDVEASEIFTVSGNVITVRLSEKSGFSYSFFKDIDVEMEYQSQSDELKISISENVEE